MKQVCETVTKCACGTTLVQKTHGKRTQCPDCVKKKRKEYQAKWYAEKGRAYFKEYKEKRQASRIREDAEPGWATCPWCGKKWWSPDHTYIKYHPRCREAVSEAMSEDGYSEGFHLHTRDSRLHVALGTI